MRIVQVRRGSRRIACSLAAEPQGYASARAGNPGRAKQRKMRCEDWSPQGGQEAVPAEELQQLLWKQFFADTAQWWDNRYIKRTPRHADFTHKVSKIALWLSNPHKPVWVDSQLAAMDARLKTTTETRTTTPQRPGASAVNDFGMCRKLCEDGLISDAVDVLDLFVRQGYHVSNHLFYLVLKRCIRHKHLTLGRRIHALSVQNGYEGDAFLATQLIVLYSSHDRLDEAIEVFTSVTTPNVYNWATIISAHVRQGEAYGAIRLYRQLFASTTLKPDDRVYSAVLKACISVKDLDVGKEVHADILASSKKPDSFVQNGLVSMYAKCGCLEDARRLFDKLKDRDVVTWTAMIAGYAQQGLGQEALNLYSSMQQQGFTPNSVTYACLLQACASVGLGAYHQGMQLHSQMGDQCLEKDEVLGGSLVNMYVKCGGLDEARRLFDKLPHRNVVAWTAMIAGYAQQGMGQEALNLYRSMQLEGLTPDFVTYVCLLQACASLGVEALLEGKQLHVQIEERGWETDSCVAGSLVNMYVKCGSLKDAFRMFETLPNRDVVAWNAMIAGCAQQGMGQEALRLYSSMQQDGLIPNSVTYVCLLQACASIGVGALHEGKGLHAQIQEKGLEEGAVVGGSLVNMYVKCGSIGDARRLFDKLPSRNVIAWNAMIAGYAHHDMGLEALSLYSGMHHEGLTPDSVTYVCLLHACAVVAALRLGEQLHAEIEKGGTQIDALVGAALVNMYAKCGSMYDSQRVFDSLPARSVEAWGALMNGYAHQGDDQVVFNLLSKMIAEGIQPDGIIFLSVLTVCSHVGLVDEGREYFEAMGKEFGIYATMDHYICMVDLLGRAGHLDEALQMAKNVSHPPSSVIWLTLLSACRKWKNVEVGRQAFEGAISLDDKDGAAYVLMSNIYASTQMWEAVKEMTARRINLGAWKKPGQSWWTDMGGRVHTFVVGDRKHVESEGIYSRLEQLIPKLKKEGYVPHLESSLLDLPEEKKQAELCGHSEKLAIAYALNNTAEGTTIRIVKNLRVCEDCHVAIAYISKVEKRTIVCRDTTRFHVYNEGACSCGDYW